MVLVHLRLATCGSRLTAFRARFRVGSEVRRILDHAVAQSVDVAQGKRLEITPETVLKGRKSAANARDSLLCRISSACQDRTSACQANAQCGSIFSSPFSGKVDLGCLYASGRFDTGIIPHTIMIAGQIGQRLIQNR